MRGSGILVLVLALCLVGMQPSTGLHLERRGAAEALERGARPSERDLLVVRDARNNLLFIDARNREILKVSSLLAEHATLAAPAPRGAAAPLPGAARPRLCEFPECEGRGRELSELRPSACRGRARGKETSLAVAIGKEQIVAKEKRIRIEQVPIEELFAEEPGRSAVLPGLPRTLILLYIEDVVKILGRGGTTEVIKRKLETACPSTPASLCWGGYRQLRGLRGRKEASELYVLKHIGDYFHLSKISFSGVSDFESGLLYLTMDVAVYAALGCMGVFLAIPCALRFFLRSVGTLKAISVEEERAFGRMHSGRMFNGAEVSVLAVDTRDPYLLQEYANIQELAGDSPGMLHPIHVEKVSEHVVHLAFDRLDGTFKNLLPKLKTEAEVLAVAEQLVRAVTGLHEKGYAHLDITPENIYFRHSNGQPQIALGGLGRMLPLQGLANGESKGGCGAEKYDVSGWEHPRYISGAFGKDALCDRDYDYYSLGCVLHLMVHGAHPFVSEIKANLRRHQEVALEYAELIGRANVSELSKKSYFFALVNGRRAWKARLFTSQSHLLPTAGPSTHAVLSSSAQLEIDDLVAICLVDEASLGVEAAKRELIKTHVLFWGAEKKFEFLATLSDYIFDHPQDGVIEKSPLYKSKHRPRSWASAIDSGLMESFTRGGKYVYNHSQLRDLYRIVRNNGRHFQSIPSALRQEHFGDEFAGYVGYFLGRFPFLGLFAYYLAITEKIPGLAGAPSFRLPAS